MSEVSGLGFSAKNLAWQNQDWLVTSDIGKEDNGYWK